MDFADDLTAAQTDELHRELLALRDELTALIESAKGGAAPVQLDQSSVGRVSRVDAIQGQQMAKANLENHELRLRLVWQALSRVERDEYGLCRKCEEPIGYARLKAQPESALCLSCQGARERGT